MDTELFFDSTATWYDKMVNFDNAINIRKVFYKQILGTDAKTGFDIGCGSGIDSISISLIGNTISGYDISENMLNQARNNAQNYNCNIKFINKDLSQNITELNKVDFIVSMGNTIANIPNHRLDNLFQNINNLLNKNGIFVFQVVNYHKILNNKERILNITESDSDYYIRFYDFTNEDLNFNILKFDKSNTKKRELITTKLYPYLIEDFLPKLEKLFNNVELFSGFSLKNFDINNSDDLIVICKN